MKPLRIIIFAKCPQPGFAKTRLIPALGEAGAAQLATRMFDAAIAKANEAGIGAVELCVTPDVTDRAWREMKWPPDLTVTSQGDGDLGARMARAAKRAIDRGEAPLLIGTDCIELDVARIREAGKALSRAGVVINPTFDGGYALLGLTHFHPTLFADIAWSTDTVAQTTIDRIAALGWPLRIGDKLHDIDEVADLVWLPEDWRKAITPD